MVRFTRNGVALPVWQAAASINAADWKVDPAKSVLGFSGTQLGQPFRGKFGKYQAAVAFDPDHPETSRIDVTVDLASAATGDQQCDGAMPGEDWFNVAKFPQARFVTTSVRSVSGNNYEAQGTLTIRGVTMPATLPFHVDIDGATAHANGHADLVRTAFGVGQGTWATGQWVAVEVRVDVDITATRAN